MLDPLCELGNTAASAILPLHTTSLVSFSFSHCHFEILYYLQQVTELLFSTLIQYVFCKAYIQHSLQIVIQLGLNFVIYCQQVVSFVFRIPRKLSANWTLSKWGILIVTFDFISTVAHQSKLLPVNYFLWEDKHLRTCRGQYLRPRGSLVNFGVLSALTHSPDLIKIWKTPTHFLFCWNYCLNDIEGGRKCSIC